MNEKQRMHFIKNLRRDSGNVKSKDPLTSFLYTLMRDHLPTGTVEAIIQEIELYKNNEIIFTNGWLAQYAENLANRIDADRLHETNKKLRTCVELMQSIMNHGDMEADTPNEGALMKAMELAGYPVNYVKSFRDIEQDYKQHEEDKEELIMSKPEYVGKFSPREELPAFCGDRP